MEKLIASCGLDCAACEARIATLANDDVLRLETAEKWMQQFGATGITIDMINCTGCREPGAKFGHCYECQVRNCVISKGFQTCAECEKMESCDLVGQIHHFSPAAKENLRSLT
jgi:hypothetical protein